MTRRRNDPDFVNDLWGAFTTHCGHCHVDGALGGYHVTRDSFAAQMLVDGNDNIVTKFIESSDPNVAMPRGNEGAGQDTGIDFTKRPMVMPSRRWQIRFCSGLALVCPATFFTFRTQPTANRACI